MTDTETSKYLHEYRGMCWHESDWNGEVYVCTCGYIDQIRDCSGTNANYLTSTEDRQALLEWAVKEEWWGKFLAYKELLFWNHPSSEAECDYEAIDVSLLIPVDALARALYSYLKGREG